MCIRDRVSKGARCARSVLSRSQTAQSAGQGASLHSTAVYTARAFSRAAADSGSGRASRISGSGSPARKAASAAARSGQPSS